MEDTNERIVSRRGIKPFENGADVKEAEIPNSALESQQIELGGMGKIMVSLFNPGEEFGNNEAFYISKDGEIDEGMERNLIEKGYRQLMIHRFPNSQGSLKEIRHEVENIGDVDSLVWKRADQVMRAQLDPDSDQSLSMVFLPDGTEQEPRNFYVPADEEFLKDLKIGFERPVDLGGEN